MKTTGVVWKEYLDSWPTEQWFDDADDRVNGKEDQAEIPDDAIVEFTTGTVFKGRDDRDGVSLVSHFSKWLKARDSITMVVSIPKTEEAKLREAVKGLKGTIR